MFWLEIKAEAYVFKMISSNFYFNKKLPLIPFKNKFGKSKFLSKNYYNESKAKYILLLASFLSL